MPLSFVAASTGSIDSGTNIVINKPAGVLPGDVLIVVTNGLVVTAPSGFWGKAAEGTNPPFGELRYLFARASEPSTYSWTFNTSDSYVVACAAYRGLRRESAFVPNYDFGVRGGSVFAFTDTILFDNATDRGVVQESGMLFVAGAATYNNGSSTSYSWPPSGMTSRASVTSSNGKASARIADKLDINPPISSQTPGGITFSHSGGSFQEWLSFTMLINRFINTQSVI